MKKIVGILILVMMLTGSFVLAETDLEDLPPVRVLPGSFLYPLKLVGENVKTLFFLNQESKAERYHYLSELRLSELQELIEKDNFKHLDSALARYQKQQNKLEGLIDRATQRGIDWSLLAEEIEVSAENHLNIISDFQSKIPDTAIDNLEEARAVARGGQIRAMEMIANNQAEPNLDRYQELMDKRLNQFESEVFEGDDLGAEMVLADWRAYNKSRQNISREQLEIIQSIGEAQAETIDRMDQLEQATSENSRLREQLWQSRLEAVEAQVENLRQLGEGGYWLEAQDNFTEMITNRANHLEQQIQNMAQECPIEQQETCLAIREKLTDFLSQEYKKYADLGEEVIQGDLIDSIDSSTNSVLNQVGTQAMIKMGQLYEEVVPEAKAGLEQAMTSAERLRQLSQEALQQMNQEGLSFQAPALQSFQQRIEEGLAPQIENVRVRVRNQQEERVQNNSVSDSE